MVGSDEVNELTMIRVRIMIIVKFESNRSQKGVNFRPGPGVAALASTGRICLSRHVYNFFNFAIVLIIFCYFLGIIQIDFFVIFRRVVGK